VGATAAGQEYLLTKTLLQSSMALNVAMYLLLKSEEQQQSSSPSEMDYMGPETTSAIPSHPVMARLEQWNSISLTLEDGVEEKVATLKEQMDNLVKAAALMQSEQGDDEDEASADDDESVDQEQTAGTDETKVSSSAPITPAESSQDEGDDDDAAQQEIGRNVLNEAKFGLRANEVAPSKKRTRRKVVFDDDFVGDGNDDDDEPNKSSFASTLNAIEQRSSTKSKKKQRADVEQLDNAEEDDDELRQGLKMMEEEMGRLDGNEDLGPMNMDDPDGDGGEIDDELEDGDDFYSKVAKKSKDKKAFKKSLYQVAPKYPRIDMEVEGERAISQTILKNRGLVPHKAKINRNPRVKKREQYRKAKIRRKGAVREVRTDEGHKYAGEQTGVKTGLSRSRKLIS
jgi:U3 small nucleolar RNA-associated protein 3